jgi:hypothetical protein
VSEAAGRVCEEVIVFRGRSGDTVQLPRKMRGNFFWNGRALFLVHVMIALMDRVISIACAEYAYSIDIQIHELLMLDTSGS